MTDTNQKLREALQVALDALTFDGFCPQDITHRTLCAEAASQLRQALALPTAAPVGELERFEAWWRSVQLMTFPKEYDIECLQDWESVYKPKALDAWQARAALSADDAVDAQRYRLLRRGQHWSVINGIGDVLRADALDAEVDAAMARGGE